MVELCVVKTQVDDEGPILLLRENDREWLPPVWIPTVDVATATITLEQEQFARPLTQDLLAEAFAQLTGESQPQLTIRSMKGSVLHTEIVVDGMTFDARSSGVVAVAIRQGWPVHCPAELPDEVRISDEIAHMDGVGRFRGLLDQVQPENL